MHGLGNPWRLFGEVMDVANRPFMSRELFLLQRAGVRLHAVQFDEDGFFPLEQATARTPGLVDTFTVMTGADHLAPQRQPDVVATHIAEAISRRYLHLVAA